MKSVLHRTNRCLTIFQTQVAVWACATWMVAATTCFAQAQQDYDVFSEINPPSTIQQGNQLGFVSPSNQVSFVDELTLDQVPLPQALALISKQTDLKLLASAEARNVEISLDVREMNAIDLLRVMTRVNGLWYQHDKDTNIYMIFADKEAKPQDFGTAERIAKLQRELNEAFPDSLVRLSLVGRQVVVRGQAHDVVEASRILRLVNAEMRMETADTTGPAPTEVPASQSFAGIGFSLEALNQSSSAQNNDSQGLQVIDMLSVIGEQQVAMRVTVAEVNRAAARGIGLNFGYQEAGEPFSGSLTGGLASIDDEGIFQVSQLANLPVALDNGQIRLAINALQEHSLSRTLAEPTLTALNGQEASFHAGGQFPVPVVGGNGVGGDNVQGVNFIPFGVQLEFIPLITDRDRIRLTVGAEVSDLDPTIGTAVGGVPDQGGTQVNGLRTRNFQTTVELREGQTLAVAGLIQSDYNAASARLPLLGRLPGLGNAFGNTTSASNEQELVILITPELVKSLDTSAHLALPGSDIFEPSDVEFYLGGKLEGRPSRNFRGAARTDVHKADRFYNGRDEYIIGPSGYRQSGSLSGTH